MAKSNGAIQVEDYAGQTAAINPNLQDLDAAGLLYGSIATDLDELKDGIIPLMRGKVRFASVSFKFPDTDDPVTDVEAARESKWLVSYRDTTEYLGALNTVPNPGFNQIFTFEIPTAKRSLLDDNEEYLDLTDTVPAAAIAAIEPNIRSPYNRAAAGTPTNVVLSIKYVGRNT